MKRVISGDFYGVYLLVAELRYNAIFWFSNFSALLCFQHILIAVVWCQFRWVLRHYGWFIGNQPSFR